MHVGIVHVAHDGVEEEMLVVEGLISYIEMDSSVRVSFGLEDGFLH